MMTEPTVFIVDDDPAVRLSLVELLDSAGHRSQVFESAEAFLDSCLCDQPGCLVLDIRMSGMTGLELQEQLRARSSRMPTIVITGHGDVQAARRSFKLGALDFVTKPFEHSEILQLIEAAIHRDAIARAGAQRAREVSARRALLSPREREVMDCIVDGLLNKQIAAKLGIAERTVEDHRRRIMQVMRVESVAGLVRSAVVAWAVHTWS